MFSMRARVNRTGVTNMKKNIRRVLGVQGVLHIDRSHTTPGALARHRLERHMSVTADNVVKSRTKPSLAVVSLHHQ